MSTMTKPELEKRLAELESQNEELKALAISSGKMPIPIIGVFRAKSGKGNSLFRFKAGAVFIRVEAGKKVPTEELMKIARDEKYQPDANILSAFPALAEYNATTAAEHLQYLADIQYGRIEKVTDKEEVEAAEAWLA